MLGQAQHDAGLARIDQLPEQALQRRSIEATGKQRGNVRLSTLGADLHEALPALSGAATGGAAPCIDRAVHLFQQGLPRRRMQVHARAARNQRVGFQQHPPQAAVQAGASAGHHRPVVVAAQASGAVAGPHERCRLAEIVQCQRLVDQRIDLATLAHRLVHLQRFRR
ncbi:hypothetical protein D3C73_1136260 [compost metagenome]